VFKISFFNALGIVAEIDFNAIVGTKPGAQLKRALRWPLETMFQCISLIDHDGANLSNTEWLPLYFNIHCAPLQRQN
jgi:hypothetical protein